MNILENLAADSRLALKEVDKRDRFPLKCYYFKDSCLVTKRVVVLVQTVTCIVSFGIFVYTLLVDMFCRGGGLNENRPHRLTSMSALSPGSGIFGIFGEE